MANPDIPAALVVLQAHLLAADAAALSDPFLDVDRGLVTGPRQLRYYWSGEVAPPRMPGQRVLNGELVGQRFRIAASWPTSDLSLAQITVIDTEMQLLTGQIRTRIQGDSQLGGNVTDLDLGYFEPDMVLVSNVRLIILAADLDLSYVEYQVAS